MEDLHLLHPAGCASHTEREGSRHYQIWLACVSACIVRKRREESCFSWRAVQGSSLHHDSAVQQTLRAVQAPCGVLFWL